MSQSPSRFRRICGGGGGQRLAYGAGAAAGRSLFDHNIFLGDNTAYTGQVDEIDMIGIDVAEEFSEKKSAAACGCRAHANMPQQVTASRPDERRTPDSALIPMGLTSRAHHNSTSPI